MVGVVAASSVPVSHTWGDQAEDDVSTRQAMSGGTEKRGMQATPADYVDDLPEELFGETAKATDPISKAKSKGTAPPKKSPPSVPTEWRDKPASSSGAAEKNPVRTFHTDPFDSYAALVHYYHSRRRRTQGSEPVSSRPVRTAVGILQRVDRRSSRSCD